jgi:predicted SnoaL-like aldol condensation-catalyzing enzyme
VKSVVQGKSLEELDAIQQAVAAQFAAGETKIVEHWQEVAQLIRVDKAMIMKAIG